MQVYNATRQRLLIKHARLATTFWQRLRGLMGAATLPEGEGLILVGDKSIHTFFMRFPIDVVYADKSGKVIRLDAKMAPYRIGPFVAAARFILEMPVGVIASTGTQVGDQLEIKD